MKSLPHIFALLLLSVALVSCTGIPLRSLPKLYSLQSQLLDSNPAEFMLAVQIDAKMSPPPSAAPMLQIKIAPDKVGTYTPIDKKIVLRAVANEPSRYRLPEASATRRWLIYALPPEAQTELAQTQAMFRKLQSQKQAGDTSKNTLYLGIAFEQLAVDAPQFAATRFDTWLQASAKEGFFEMWSGSVGQLLDSAKKKS